MILIARLFFKMQGQKESGIKKTGNEKSTLSHEADGGTEICGLEWGPCTIHNMFDQY